MNWWNIIKTKGTVMAAPAQGGKGNPSTDALFNVSYGNDCGCGKEDCKCQNE